MHTTASRRFYSRAALVLLHADDAVFVVLGFAGRRMVEHARKLADGAIGPAHRGHPGLQVVPIDLVAEHMLACLDDAPAVNLWQVCDGGAGRMSATIAGRWDVCSVQLLFFCIRTSS